MSQCKFNLQRAFLLLFLFLKLIFADTDNSLTFSTNECYLDEPVYNNTFDFRPLHTEFAHVAISSQGDRFEFNLCGNLTRTCNGQSNVAACLYKDNTEYVLGTQQTLNYRNGKMFFTFSNSSKCPFSNKEENFQLHIFMNCDYSLDTNPLTVTLYSKDACSYYITYETPVACLPEPKELISNSCSVQDPKTGHEIDLFPLSDFNYRTADRNGSSFVINICKPVLYDSNAMCPPGSSVCYISSKATNVKYKFANYGTANSSPIIENDQLLMRFQSDRPYNKTHNYTSIINFKCDMSVKNGRPEFDFSYMGQYHFTFLTSFACGQLAPCTAITHGSLDLRKLINKPFTLSLQNKNYTIGVCSAAGTPCNEKDGSCLIENGQPTSLGATNTNLRFNLSGTPYLLYQNGAVCQNPNNDVHTSWSTKIEFVCANNATKDNNVASVGPKIIENSNCQLLIHYPTELACDEQIKCKANYYGDHPENGETVGIVDLTPLISANENYEAQVDASLIEKNDVHKDTKFYLNVCRPLVPKFGLGCPGGSAACMATLNSNSPTPEKEMSMGFPLISLVATSFTTAELHYVKGGICPTDKKSEMSTVIKFHCDMRAGLGTPVLRTIDDCHYEFEWATNVICPTHLCVFDAQNCEILNDDINLRFNLKKASFTNQGKITIKSNKTDVILDVCDISGKAVTDYSQQSVNFYFQTAGVCKSSDKMNVQLRLVCSNETENATTYLDEHVCKLEYVLHTPEVCGFIGLNKDNNFVKPTYTTITTTTTVTTTTSTSKTETSENKPEHPTKYMSSIGTVLAVISTLVLFTICLGIVFYSPARRHACRRLFRRSSSSVRYSRVRSNEEANLLLEPNGEFTDSDDDMLL